MSETRDWRKLHNNITAVYHQGYQTKKDKMEWGMVNAQAIDVTAPNMREVQP